MGLSLRQLLCSIVALGVAVGVYFGLRNFLGQETVSWVCIVAAVPVAAAGFFQYDGLNFEKFLLAVLHSEALCAGPRLWKAENCFAAAQFAKQQKLRKANRQAKQIRDQGHKNKRNEVKTVESE